MNTSTPKIARKSFFISNIYLAVSVLISFTILFDNYRPDFYRYLWVLPLMFGIFVWAYSLISDDIWYNLSTIALVGIFSIRNLITPLLMRLGNYDGYFRMLNTQNVNKAIALMIYESVILFIYITWQAKRESYFTTNDRKKTIVNFAAYDKEKVLIAFFVLFLIITRILRPDYYSGYSNIFASTAIRLTEVSESALGALYTLFTFICPLAYTVICVYLIKIINSRFEDNIFRVLLNLVILIIPLFFMSNSDGFTLITIASLALVMYRVGGINKKILIVVVGGSFVTIFMYILLMVVGMSFGSESTPLLNQLSKAFQAYFPGVCNFAGFFNVGGYNKATTLFYDIYSTIPFRNTLFGVEGDNRLVILYANDNGAKSQILPCVCQLFFYFSVFAPIIECLFAKYSLRAYRVSLSQKNIYMLFVNNMCFIYCALTPIMYNFTIFFTRFFLTIIPMSIIARLIDGRIHNSET